jgi:hypothetical protein
MNRFSPPVSWLYSQCIGSNGESGRTSEAYVYYADENWFWPVTNFVNASLHMKENLKFLLRSATVSRPFSYVSNLGPDGRDFSLGDPDNPVAWYGRSAGSTEYEYSGFHIFGAYQNYSVMDELRPVIENHLWRNFAYDPLEFEVGRGVIEAVRHVHQISLSDLHGIDGQKKIVEQNTRQFVAGYPANNVLLTGARGTGKSSLIKALLNKYAPRGLRVIEVDKQDLIDLPEIVDHIDSRAERFILFCDDLSFDAD